tara:strand:- start:6 stop:416 length:411 start_codon:yes stop_codon:yes gene_type:complete
MSDVVHISDEFKQTTKEFDKIDDLIKQLEGKLKELRIQKRDYSEKMLSFVKSNQLQGTEFKVNNKKIKYVQTRSIQPINRDYINQRINEFSMPYSSTVGSDFADKLTDYIFENRPYVEREYIKSTLIRRMTAAKNK